MPRCLCLYTSYINTNIISYLSFTDSAFLLTCTGNWFTVLIRLHLLWLWKEFLICSRFSLIFLVICVVRVGSSAYGDQIMLQFIVQRQPRITLDNLKEVIDTELKQWVNCLKTWSYVSLALMSLTVRGWLML